MNAQTTQVDDLHLVALPSAVNCAELFVRFSLTEWSLRELADEAAQAANGLLTAALESATSQEPGFLMVRVRLSGDHLGIEVEDSHEQDTGNPPPEPSNGRSGVVPLEGRGRLLWLELPLPEGLTASAVPLPRRERKKSQMAEQTPDDDTEMDPEMMERLLSGLSRPPESSE